MAWKIATEGAELSPITVNGRLYPNVQEVVADWINTYKPPGVTVAEYDLSPSDELDWRIKEITWAGARWMAIR